MRGVTDCVTANPFHKAGACRFPYTFRATLHVESLPHLEITGVNFKLEDKQTIGDTGIKTDDSRVVAIQCTSALDNLHVNTT